ncbi:hypothetical protein IWW56_003118 [Coemansia sp. RSA 2131]|nr:hypothetical protein IWW56_003118 [Coemansia sp. RSA 2131]
MFNKLVEGEWSAYTYDTDEGVGGIADYIDNQRWHEQLPSDSLAYALCSPFNFCGKALAVFAEASIAFERILPIPRWLALLLIPSFMAFVGRFIIDGMYAAEDRVRSTLSTQQPGDTAVIDKKAQ